MNIILSAKNFQLNDSHRQFIEKKFQSLHRRDPSIFEIRVELDADKKERKGMKFRTEVWVKGKHSVKAGAQSKTMFSAIDNVIPKLQRLIVKMKEKR